jgi:RNase adapter protein RapZ
MEHAATDTPHVLVVTGMSGAGRSTAAKVLEDLEYVVIDNLPPHLLELAVQSHDIPDSGQHLAVVIDSRSGLPMEDLRRAMIGLERSNVITTVVFLDADDDVLVERYLENRRPHPMGSDTIAESIIEERKLLEELRETADVVIDTSGLNVHELRKELTQLFSEDKEPRPMRVSLRTFGFKHGTPRDLDLMFDVRFLPNPHWIPELKEQTGVDAPVSDYVLTADGAGEFVDQVEQMLTFLIPRFRSEGKSYLSIGIGCTGGHHRSVAIAEELKKRLAGHGIPASLAHRDIEK